jgi:predicted nucleotidyltransferase
LLFARQISLRENCRPKTEIGGILETKGREGDLIENITKVFFDVKGQVHPPNKIVAFPRFIPNASGNRKRGNIPYRKVYSLSKRFQFLELNLSNYLVHDHVFDEILCEVPVTDVENRYEPAEKLQHLRSSKDLDMPECRAVQLTELLKEEANSPWSALGISGSLLVGLHTARSDIDPVVYGSKNCRRVHSALKSLLKDEKGAFKPYSLEDLKVLFDFRSKDTVMNFEDFVRTESRKVMQGKFMETDYFMRFVKDWDEINEIYGDVRYRNCGYAKIKATIADDSESIFTPCVYKLGNVQILEGQRLEAIEEIASFRGRFCEHAKNDEAVVAQGKVEQVTGSKHDHEHFRLLLGNKPSDFMVLA